MKIDVSPDLPPDALPTNAEPLRHTVTVAFGKRREDTALTFELMTLAELSESFQTPDTSRGTLAASEYHALSKDDPAQKSLRGHEKNGPYFCVANFKPGGRRDDDYVESVWAVVLDFDTGRTTESHFRERLKEWFFTAYTSYSHRPNDERWRVVIPYAKPVSTEQHKLVFDYFNTLFDGDLDKRGRVPSQAWYTPACPADAEGDFKSFTNEGPLFDTESVRAAKNPEAKTDQGRSVTTSHAAAVDVSRLTSALEAVPSDDRDTWIKVGLALKDALGEAGLPVWQKWSATSSKFDPAELEKTWGSFKPASDGKATVGLGTIFHLAKERGWVSLPTWLVELNREFFISPYGGKVAIFREARDTRTGCIVATPMRQEDFSLLMRNKKATVTVGDDEKEILVGPAWLSHPKRREYKGVVFDPDCKDPGYYNHWRGWAVTPAPGSWSLLQEHIRANICSGNSEFYDYLVNWMAYCVQLPAKPAEVAIVLQGGRGTGKGVFIRTFGELFAPHFWHATTAKHLTGQYNDHLGRSLLVFADEAFWAGDKTAESALKGLITEAEFSMEAKYFAVEQAANRLKLMMASNSDWVVPAGLDERRFFVLAVGDAHQQDSAYFKAIRDESAQGGKEAMLHDLLRRDLSQFDIRKVPNTAALQSQKVLSLNSVERWWLDRLKDGEWRQFDAAGPHINEWSPVPKDLVHDSYVAAMRKTGISRLATQTELGMGMRKLLPAGWPVICKRTDGHGGRRVPIYELPPLAECRLHFEDLVGLDGYEWPGDLAPAPACTGASFGVPAASRSATQCSADLSNRSNL